MYQNKTRKNIDEHITSIVTIDNQIKRKFLNLWYELYEDCYSEYNQYGLCLRNNKTGVLTPKGNWSPINQFNTNYTINSKLIQKLNEWISNDFFFRGISEVNGMDIKEITFNKEDFFDSEDYVEQEIDNYFFWLRHYKNKIFLNQEKMTQNDFLNELFEIAAKTLGLGTYGELCVEFFLKRKYPTTPVFRTSAVRGDKNDMIGGCDLYIIDGEKTKKFQTKVTKIGTDNIFKKLIDVNYYKRLGIDYLVLVDLNYNFIYNTMKPDRMVFLRMEDDLIIKKPNGYTYNNNHVIMENNIDNIFHSQVFFEFFVYCTKNDVEFLLEVGDDTSFNFDKNERKLNVILPSKSEDINNEKIKESWVEIIELISKDDTDKKTMLGKLQYLFKN